MLSCEQTNRGCEAGINSEAPEPNLACTHVIALSEHLKLDHSCILDLIRFNSFISHQPLHSHVRFPSESPLQETGVLGATCPVIIRPRHLIILLFTTPQ